MNVKELFTDDSAVSPVIGVVLMVAITVLLAATAATFFLGIGQENTKTTPTVASSFDYSQDTRSVGGTTVRADSLKVSHDGGDSIAAENLDIVVSGAQVYTSGSYSPLDDRFQWHELGASVGPDEKVSAGDTVTVNRKSLDRALSSNVEGLKLGSGATVELVWDDPSSSSSFTLNTWQS
ncbi:MAG: type IV pilin [Halorientalis sp.]